MYGVPGRLAFFGAGPAWLLYLLGGMALALLGWGLARRQSSINGLPGTALARWLWLGPLWPVAPGRALLLGLAWWSLILLALGSLLWQAHLWLHPFLRGGAYLAFALVLDLAGVCFTLCCGLLWLARLTLWRQGPGLRSAWPPLLGWLVGLSGLVVEAAGLAATRPDWAWWEPVGMWLGEWWLGGPRDAALMAVWWVHAGLALAFLALLPWARLDWGASCKRQGRVAF